MPDYDPSARENLFRLLRLNLGKDISYDDFRMAVEEIYNFRLDHSSIPERELKTFERLFDAVTRYSPFAQDRASYPTVYKDEKQVDEAVERVRHELGIKMPNRERASDTL